MKLWKHFKTITNHKLLVMKGCFRVGLIKQGLLHDLSKYGPTEFWVGVKYYQGTRSPNVAEREHIGYSSAWLHHKGRNRHHYEYWIDYAKDMMIPVEMPTRYLVEMFIDRVAASKVYNKGHYQDSDALKYFIDGHIESYLHPNTCRDLSFLLHMLAEKGEDETFRYIKTSVLHKRKR